MKSNIIKKLKTKSHQEKKEIEISSYPEPSGFSLFGEDKCKSLPTMLMGDFCAIKHER